MTIKRIKEFISKELGWAKKSWTVWFNTAAALMGIFADNLSTLSGVVEQKIYAMLAVGVPMVNYLLRMKTQKKVSRAKEGEE